MSGEPEKGAWDFFGRWHPDGTPLTRAALNEVIQRCTEKREDGRYYPTQEGCAILQGWLQENGVPVSVAINSQDRFCFDLLEPKQ